MGYLEANAEGLERLKNLVSRLSDEQLALPAGGGWTVAALLGHLAFYDYRAWLLVLHWKKAGVGPSPMDPDNINDSMKPLLLAIPGREAARLAVEAAEAVDAEVANLPESLKPEVEALVQAGRFRTDRSLHRNEHVEQIERALREQR